AGLEGSRRPRVVSVGAVLTRPIESASPQGCTTDVHCASCGHTGRDSRTRIPEVVMKTASALTFGLSLLVASLAVAQEPPAVPAPEKEHKWLEKFVGEWESESTAMMGPEQPEVKCQGS